MKIYLLKKKTMYQAIREIIFNKRGMKRKIQFDFCLTRELNSEQLLVLFRFKN